ncbi:MAG TPA: hypothetical protein VF622_15305 [Segetibacter sp.]|jgi:hypothetical protein
MVKPICCCKIKSFRRAGRTSKNFFSGRQQTIKTYIHRDSETEIEVDYTAVLASDFPNGSKKGDELKLQGRSIFQFQDDKIIKLTDIS